MARYDYIKEINLSFLNKQIKASSIGVRYSHIETMNERVTVITNYELTEEEKTSLDSLMEAHDPNAVDIQEILKLRQLEGMQRGMEIMAEFGSENKALVVAGVIQPMDLFTIAEAAASIQGLLASGSLEMAQSAMVQIPNMPGLDEERKQKYNERITEMLQDIRAKFPIPGEGQ